MKRRNLILFSCVLFSLLLSCAKKDLSEKAQERFEAIPADKYYDSDPFSNENANLYGKWKNTSMRGGFGGGEFAPDFNYLLIKPNGIFAIVKNRDITLTGKIDTVDQQEFNSDGTLRPVVDFIPDEDTQENRQINLIFDNQKILFISDTLLTLRAPCCDRISIFLEREE